MIKKNTYKSSTYSIGECEDYLKKLIDINKDNINDGILNSCLDYLNEFEEFLIKKQISELPILFEVRYMWDCRLGSSLTLNEMYEVVEVLENEYIIKDNFGELCKLPKDMFIVIG